MAFPAVATSNTTAAGWATSTLVCNMPASIASGDLLLSLIHTQDNIVWPTPSGWTLVTSLAGNGATEKTWVFAKTAAGSDTFNIDRTTVGGDAANIILRITGWYGTVAGGVEASIVGFGGHDGNPPSLTPAWGSADTLWIAGQTGDAVSGRTAPTNYGGLVSSGSAGATDFTYTATRALNAATEDPGVFGGATAAFAFGITVAVRPVAGGSAAAPARKLLLGVGA